MRTDDGYIISKCLNDEPEAFGILVDKYKSSIFAFVYTKLRNFHDAQDVTQEVFIKAYRELHTLKRWDSFAGWIYRIAYNKCKDSLLSKSRRPDCDFIEDQNQHTLDKPSIDSYRNDIMCQSLREALDSLPEIYREVLTLYYLGGMDSVEIANVLSTSPTAIRHRLSRAREQLKEEVLAMMNENFVQQRLGSSFTFRVVEAIKHIKIQPVSQPRGLPWGLSLATGLIIAVISLNPHLVINNLSNIIGGSPLPVESKVLKVGEIPVDVTKIDKIPFLSSMLGKGSSGAKQPDMQNTFFMAPQGEGKWTKRTNMPTARAALCATATNGKIYVIGGMQNVNTILSNVEEYDPIKDKWEMKSGIREKKWWLSACSVNGKVYAFGGADANSICYTSVEEYDPVADKWTKKNDMPKGLSESAFCTLGSKIYVFGGVNNNDKDFIDNIVYEFDPIKDSWAEKANMPTAKYCMSACPVNGKIYVIGGVLWDGNVTVLSTVEEYDPIADTWTKKSDMPTSRGAIAACVVGTKIYAMGGSKTLNADAGMTTVEIYDTLTDTWTKGMDMQIPRWAFSASAIDGKIYSIGGWSNRALPDVEEFDTGFISKSVTPSGKFPTTWGQRKLDR